MILCAASSYEKKYYLNPDFASLPTQIKNELQAMCVLFAEEVGGVIMLRFDDNGKLMISTSANEGDGLYDDIGAGLLVKKLQTEKLELFESLEKYYELVYKKNAKEDENAEENEELTMSILGLDDALAEMTDAELDEYFESLDDDEIDRFNRYGGFITSGYDDDYGPDDEDEFDDMDQIDKDKFKDYFFEFKDLSEEDENGEKP